VIGGNFIINLKSIVYSKERRDYLKQAFKNILDNIVCLETKCFHATFKNTDYKELIQKIGKKRQIKYNTNKEIEYQDFF